MCGHFDETSPLFNDCTLPSSVSVSNRAVSMSFRGHEAAVLCLQFDAFKIVSGSCDKTIKVTSNFTLVTCTIHFEDRSPFLSVKTL